MVQRGMTKKLHYIIVEIELKSLIYPLQKHLSLTQQVVKPTSSTFILIMLS